MSAPKPCADRRRGRGRPERLSRHAQRPSEGGGAFISTYRSRRLTWKPQPHRRGRATSRGRGLRENVADDGQADEHSPGSPTAAAKPYWLAEQARSRSGLPHCAANGLLERFLAAAPAGGAGVQQADGCANGCPQDLADDQPSTTRCCRSAGSTIWSHPPSPRRSSRTIRYRDAPVTRFSDKLQQAGLPAHSWRFPHWGRLPPDTRACRNNHHRSPALSSAGPEILG